MVQNFNRVFSHPFVSCWQRRCRRGCRLESRMHSLWQKCFIDNSIDQICSTLRRSLFLGIRMGKSLLDTKSQLRIRCFFVLIKRCRASLHGYQCFLRFWKRISRSQPFGIPLSKRAWGKVTSCKRLHVGATWSHGSAAHTSQHDGLCLGLAVEKNDEPWNPMRNSTPTQQARKNKLKVSMENVVLDMFALKWNDIKTSRGWTWQVPVWRTARFARALHEGAEVSGSRFACAKKKSHLEHEHVRTYKNVLNTIVKNN